MTKLEWIASGEALLQMGINWRSWWVALGCITAFGGIIVRLFMIQVVSTRSFSNEQVDLIQLAEQKQNREIVIDSGRGDIFDRKGRMLAGKKNWHLLVFPHSRQQIALKQTELTALAHLIGYSWTQLSEQLVRLSRPIILPQSSGDELILSAEAKAQITQLHLSGIWVVASDQRMTWGQLAQSVLGQLARNSFLMQRRFAEQVESGTFTLHSHMGISGLEAAFERFLHSEEEDILIYTKDSKGKPLNGMQVKIRKKEEQRKLVPRVIVTTLDKEIQQKVEQILVEEKVADGAVVVQEIATGNLLALGSSPTIATAGKEQNPWENRALMEATPGSIFKTVVAIAALNEGIVTPEKAFICKGEDRSLQILDANYAEHHRGHGKQTFAEAYADSCNVVFGQVAATLGAAKLEAYAKQLGLAQTVIWRGPVKDSGFAEAEFRQIREEQQGLIFHPKTNQTRKSTLAYTGIGQQDVRMTPIQAANLLTALFHKGKTIQPRLATEVREEKGGVVFSFVNKYLPTARPLKPSTLLAMRKMMRAVVTQGTATSVATAKWPLAGKTGTAQVGVDKSRYHRWMIGFGPAEHPRYSVAVLIRSVPDAEDPRAKRIFKSVMDELAQLERQQVSTSLNKKTQPFQVRMQDWIDLLYKKIR
jgi:penicillin-binding protein 4B